MAKFRTRVRKIEAEQFRIANGATDHAGVCIGGKDCENAHWKSIVVKPHLHTMQEGQTVFLEDGDWIIPEPDGVHYYPIYDAVMQKNYERVD